MAPPLQYSCLENPMDGGAWKAAVHGVTKSLNLRKQKTTMGNVRTKHAVTENSMKTQTE